MRQIVYIPSPEDQALHFETAVDAEVDENGAVTKIYEFLEISIVSPGAPPASCPVPRP